jgi:hypothetical protein
VKGDLQAARRETRDGVYAVFMISYASLNETSPAKLEN